MDNQILINYLLTLLRNLCTIATRGEDTVTMGNSLVLLQQLINSIGTTVETTEISFKDDENEEE